MKNGYKVGQKFARDGKTMQIISANPDGTATYAEFDLKTGKLKPGFKGTLPAITKETIEVVNMLNVGAAEIDKSAMNAKTIETYQKEAEADRMNQLRKEWREADQRKFEKEQEELRMTIAKLDKLPAEKTWRAGGRIQIPAVKSHLHVYETSKDEASREEAKKEFVFKLIGLIQLIPYVQEKNQSSNSPSPYSSKTLNLLDEVKKDIVDGRIKLVEGKDAYPESNLYNDGEKVLEATSVTEFLSSLQKDLTKSTKASKAFKEYIKKASA
jgi:hypothetical protein